MSREAFLTKRLAQRGAEIEVLKAEKDMAFIEGFRHAVKLLGSEGDYRNVDWSKPYKFLKKAAADQEKLRVTFGNGALG